MKEFWKKKKTVWLAFGIIVLLIAAAAGIFAWYAVSKSVSGDRQTDGFLDMREQAGKKNTVTEEGSISVGTKSQVFEMDLSEFSGESVSYSWNMEGEMPQLVDQNTGNAAETSSSRLLKVEEVYVRVGEEVKAGDPLLKVTADTLEQIRSELQSDVDEAKETYDQAVTSGKQTQAEAAAELKENQLYGQYADTEYQIAVEELSEAVDTLTEQIGEKQSSLTEAKQEAEALEASVKEQEAALEKAVYLVESQDRLQDTYGWLTAVNAKEDIERTIENLNDELETAAESCTLLEEEIESLNRELLTAQKELETGTAEAESARKIRQIKSTNAQEIYDVTAELADFDTQNALEDYEKALDRLEELDSYVADQVIVAEADGIVTDVLVTAGDTLEEDTGIISYNSYSDVTVTLTVDEEDMDAAALGSSAQVTVSAFPDEILEGKVTEIGDAEINSNTNTTTYEVVVTIQENASRLYEGMTASVTFYRDGAGQEEENQ